MKPFTSPFRERCRAEMQQQLQDVYDTRNAERARALEAKLAVIVEAWDLYEAKRGPKLRQALADAIDDARA